MISWKDVYDVIAAMAPLYIALALGYASVRLWHMFALDHSNSINRLYCYFILPFFGFDFISHVNPYTMNYKYIIADVIGKAIIFIASVVWVRFSHTGNFSLFITAFSLSSLTNTLVVGVPLLQTVYGQLGFDIVIQSFVLQSLLWNIVLLFMLEWRKAKSVNDSVTQLETQATIPPPSFGSIMQAVLFKLVKNPNVYSTVLALIWGLLSNRWHFSMPNIIQGCITMMSDAGSAVSMFNLGIFMGLQPGIVSAGVRETIIGMVLRFIIGPATVGVGALLLGLRGKILCVVLVQAALPQAITSFVYAQEYGLHAEILSTEVILGTLVSLPLLIAYYAILESTISH